MRIALFDCAGEFVETTDSASASMVPVVLFRGDKIYVPAGPRDKAEMRELAEGERPLAMMILGDV